MKGSGVTEEGKRRSLGRGLSALFGEEGAVGETRRPTRSVPVESIQPGRYQPRRSFDPEKLAALAASIRDKGILQPLVVRVHPSQPNAYELIAGERRWRAAQQVPLHEVPVIVRELSDQDALEIALIENLQREDLNAMEEAEAFARLMEEFGHTQEVLAKAVGKSRSHVANTLRLLALPERVRGLVSEGELTAGHARQLVGLDKAEELAEEIVERGLNVRQVEALVQRKKQVVDKPSAGKLPKGPDADTLALERELTGKLGLSVKINHRGSAGEVVVRYRSLDQLDHFLKKLG
jgi:ParB family chromosome partitioning protein